MAIIVKQNMLDSNHSMDADDSLSQIYKSMRVKTTEGFIYDLNHNENQWTEDVGGRQFTFLQQVWMTSKFIIISKMRLLLSLIVTNRIEGLLFYSF